MHQLLVLCVILCGFINLEKLLQLLVLIPYSLKLIWRAEHSVPPISTHSASSEKLEEETVIGRETGCISCKEEARIQVQSVFDCW